MRVLEQVICAWGAPAYLRSDTGSEFIAQALKTRLKNAGIQTHYIDPASPRQNPFGESFNGTLRQEHLNRELFATLAEAQVLTQKWRRYYNNKRIHTSLANKTPQQYYEAAQRMRVTWGLCPQVSRVYRLQPIRKEKRRMGRRQRRLRLRPILA